LFSQQVRELGYALDSLKKQVRIAAFFSRWLGRLTVGLREISSEHARRFLRYRSRHGLLHKGDAAALQRFTEFLRREEAIPAQKMSPVRLTAVEHCALDFGRYLRDERALSRSSLANYVPFVPVFSRIASETGKSALRV